MPQIERRLDVREVMDSGHMLEYYNSNSGSTDYGIEICNIGLLPRQVVEDRFC